jgi:serum/glucocorticoid-regulated kinase 3
VHRGAVGRSEWLTALHPYSWPARCAQAFPGVKFSFPKKKMLLGSNFDKSFLATRQRGLQEFIQKVFQAPKIAQHPAVRAFFFDAPRHGRGAQSVPNDEPIEADTSESDGSKSIPFDLGKGADTKASVKDFEMLKVIGKGSFGRVLLGKHIKTGEVFAIKVLSKEAIVKQNEVGHIMSERAVLQENVRHPFLVGLHFSFQTPQKLYVCGLRSKNNSLKNSTLLHSLHPGTTSRCWLRVAP